MKKTILIIFFFFTTLYSFSQFKKDNIYFSVNGMYSKGTSENGVNMNETSAKGETINSEMSVTAILSDCFLYGAGLDYSYQNETRNSHLTILERYSQYEEMNIKSSILAPNIFIGYYYGLTTKLFFNANLKFRFGQNKIKVDGQQALTTPLTNSNSINTTINSSNGYAYELESNYFSTSILPEFTYFLSNSFGLTLGLGGVEYSLTDWKSDNSSFLVNFNPNNWLLGMRVRF